MQGSGDLFIVQLVFCINKLYFFINIGGEVSVWMLVFDPFYPSLSIVATLETP